MKVVDKQPLLFATNIWLNYWQVGPYKAVLSQAHKEQQQNPIIARRLERDLSRNPKFWSLYSKKDGPNALLRLKGQANLQASGLSDLRLILVQQRFALCGRQIESPPDAGPFGFVVCPGQEFNANFEISIPDRKYSEGELLYGLHILYEDEAGKPHNLEVFWWYDFSEDKFWNNLNKVPGFAAIRKNFW